VRTNMRRPSANENEDAFGSPKRFVENERTMTL
jgi:hypothetical protein